MIKRPTAHSSCHLSIYAPINLYSSTDPSITFYLFILITVSSSLILYAIYPFVRAHLLVIHTSSDFVIRPPIYTSIRPSIYTSNHPLIRSNRRTVRDETLGESKSLFIGCHPHELPPVILHRPQQSAVQILLGAAFNDGCKKGFGVNNTSIFDVTLYNCCICTISE